MPCATTTQRTRARQSWRRKRSRAAPLSAAEQASASANAAHGYFDPRTHVLQLHDAFMDVWASQHTQLGRAVAAWRQRDRAMLNEAWKSFYAEVQPPCLPTLSSFRSHPERLPAQTGREQPSGQHDAGESYTLVSASLLDRAVRAAGASRRSEPFAMDGVNCAVCAS